MSAPEADGGTPHREEIAEALRLLRAEIKRRRGKDRADSRYEKWVLRVAIANAVLSALTLGAVAWSVWIVRGQLEATERTLVATERAWIIGIPEKVYLNNDTPRSFTVPMSLRNAGKGPAFEVAQLVTFSLGGPSAPPAELATRSDTELTIGGGLTVGPLIPFAKSFGIRPEQVTAVEQGALPLFVWLTVRYADPVGRNRVTQECWHYNHEYKLLKPCSGAAQIHR